MIHDLDAALEDVNLEADVCIVGGGTAGLFLAHRLRSAGLEVIILEAGGLAASSAEDFDQRCVQRGIPYRGAQSGRCFGLGGTSVLWGGQMLSLTAADIEARPYAGFPAWPIRAPEIERFIPGVLADIGLGGQLPGDADSDATVAARHYRALQSFGPGFSLRLSAWLPFKTRNFAHAFRGMLVDDARVRVWLNSNVVAIEAIPGAGGWEVQRIKAQTLSGRQLQASARFFILAAGALETTRLLLHYDESTQGSLLRAGVPLGRHFSDHLSVTCGRFRCHDWQAFNLGVAPVFIRGVMRTPRLELAPATQESLHLGSAYAHFTFVTHGDTGFDVVRNLLRTRQGEHRELGLSAARIGRVVGDVSQMCWWRYARQRLWIPRLADLLLQVDVEQRPNPASRIMLDESRDAFGRRRLIIDWRITADEMRAVRKTARLADEAWQHCTLRRAATLDLAGEAAGDDFAALYDVYHPTGALRMGTSAHESVVDASLRVWHTRNLYVCTTAVFPSAGSANPGLVHLALTARLAEKLAEQAS
jgi:choline dehydrogenase-like flavoprotein